MMAGALLPRGPGLLAAARATLGLRGIRGRPREETRPHTQVAPAHLHEVFGGDEFVEGGEVLKQMHSKYNTQDDRQRQAAVKADRQRKAALKADPQPQELKPDSYKQQIKRLKMELNAQTVTKENQFEKVRNAVTMLHHLPYDQQLKMKERKNSEVVHHLKKASRFSNFVKNCRESPIIASPVTEQYRSKDEFSLYTDIEGRPAVGFFVGTGSTGFVCVEPALVPAIKDSHKAVAGQYQAVVRRSALRPDLYLGPRSGGEPGHWSGIMVRSNAAGRLMARVSLRNTAALAPADLLAARADLIQGLVTEGGPLTSLYLAMEGAGPELLWGEANITEELQGRQFLLGPESFFQGNSAVAELLVQAVKKRMPGGYGRTFTLLDLCCGVGTYSVLLAERSRGCLGADVAGTDLAATNAANNGLTNCRFVTGKLGATMPGLAAEVRTNGNPVMAILNPGRGGVEPEVVQELRRIPQLGSLLYLSCQPEDGQVVGNMLALVREDRGKEATKPFTLREALPLDMFPHTHHCEHLFVFKRKTS